MDLDVVERAGQTVYIDDEDEFEQHSEELGYPQELIEAMRAEAAKLLPAVGHHEAPFDGRAHARFSQGRALVGRLPE
jgi:protein associated with RNAse G/E